MRVLIVDDSRAVRSLVSQMLKECDYAWEEAENGQVAVDKIKGEGGFDIVLLDWNMPVLDGMGFLDEVRSLDLLKNTRVIMMTTENSPDKISQAMQNGASEYIMKPFTADILKDKIEYVLGVAA